MGDFEGLRTVDVGNLCPRQGETTNHLVEIVGAVRTDHQSAAALAGFHPAYIPAVRAHAGSQELCVSFEIRERFRSVSAREIPVPSSVPVFDVVCPPIAAPTPQRAATRFPGFHSEAGFPVVQHQAFVSGRLRHIPAGGGHEPHSTDSDACARAVRKSAGGARAPEVRTGRAS